MSLILDFLSILCRLPNETNETALVRFHTYYREFPAGNLDAGFDFLAQQAFHGIAVTPRVLLAATGISVTQEGLTTESAQFFYEQLIQEEERRRVQKAGQQLLAIASGREGNVDDVLASINIGEASKQTALTLSEQTALGMSLYRKRIEILAQGKPRIAFPWPDINRMVPFVYDDDVILITGKSKTGKSSAVHQMAIYNSSRIPVAYFHNEDNPLKLFLRRTAQSQIAKDPTLRGPNLAGTISYMDLLSSSVKSDTFVKQIEDNSEEVLMALGDNITYIYCAGWTVEQIISEWRRLKSIQPVGLVVVDYLNKIESYSKIKTIGTMAGAMEYNVELVKREAGRKGHMTPAVLVQQENEDGTTRDTRSSYIKSQVHLSFQRDTDTNGMLNTGSIRVLRANDGMTGGIPAKFYVPYLLWVT